MTTDTASPVHSHLVSDPHGVRYEPEVPQRHGRVVVGLDGSESSLDALRRGIRMAEALHSSLVVVTTWTYPAFYGDTVLVEEYSPEKDARAILEENTHATFEGDQPDWVSLITKQGPAAATLIEESVGAEMLIVGSRGHGGLAGLLLGSVSAECAEHASCPVLIIH